MLFELFLFHKCFEYPKDEYYVEFHNHYDLNLTIEVRCSHHTHKGIYLNLFTEK